VNLERALQLSTRLGGHLVSGHVDGVGTIKRITSVGIASVYELSIEPYLMPYILPQGSISIDGTSLTVVQVASNYFSVSLIPHTFAQTTLGFKKLGDKVNLETDIIGKYVASFLGNSQQPAQKDLSLNFLAQHGFI
ncbi:MAG: riboflavin synthase, partial [Desulfitobacteriaceae bacterium]